MKFIGSILILMTSLFSADAFLSKSSVVLGESVVLVLRAEGKDIKFPKLSDVAGFKVARVGQKTSSNYINGTYTSSKEKQYEFLPLKSTDIAPFELEVDGVKQMTKALHVEVKKADMTNSPYTLEMVIKKTDVMQFEGIPVEFIFKIDENVQAKELQFDQPKFSHFWVKEGKKTEPKRRNGFIEQKLNFFIYPQKSGDFTINPASVHIGVVTRSRDVFNMLTNQLNWKRVFSNSKTLHVSRLEGANLYGNFNISLKVDKTNTEQNRGVNATLKITGDGNFDDIEPYKLDINNTSIYSDKPTLNSQASSTSMHGEFIQKFSISSNKDFTIPSQSITYYDPKTKKIVTKKTAPITLHVEAQAQEKAVQIKSAKSEVATVKVVERRSSYLELALAFVAGVMITLLVLLLRRKREYKLPKFKNNKDRLKSLLKQRGESEEIDKQIAELESRLYG